MSQIKHLYVVHHSHTDIGYTDLQERIIDCQVNYIHSAVELFSEGEKYADFRWNCETYFCVEKFLQSASETVKQKFFQYVREGKIGISATYLNFNDLMDSRIANKRMEEMSNIFSSQNIPVKTAMIADINGISMGLRDAFLDNGIEFFFTNIHTHHGMYPLYQNQNAYWWESRSGKKLLVWNGEHYNLGNALGLKPNRHANFMTQNYFGEMKNKSSLEIFRDNLTDYLNECEENGYPYDFMISSVSGVFSDNAPPNTEIIDMIREHQKAYGEEVHIQMVSLQELYELIKDKLTDAPIYRGDLNDWWGNGAGTTPYVVKHYKEAQRLYHLCQKLNPNINEEMPDEVRAAEDNLLLYAEHTWGHSSTITDPCDTMVLNLDIRKNSYASKAHENASLMLNHSAVKHGDIMRYYNTNGRIKSFYTGNTAGMHTVEFYIENMNMKRLRLVNSQTGEEIMTQLSPDPRGKRISFSDYFEAGEQKEYTYEELPEIPETLNSRKAYIGSERVKDVVNDYDKVSYRLPYEVENDWFKIEYNYTDGITSFYNKKDKKEMLSEGAARFFMPLYECTPLRHDAYEERRRLGRNIRGEHAKLYQGKLIDIKCLERGDVFTTMEFVYELEGTIFCTVVVKLHNKLPKIDFKLRIGKTLNDAVESVYMPLTLNLDDKVTYIKKGTEEFRPGMDQIPGTCMEYYMSDYGVAYQTENSSILINTLDTALLYMGEMKHHPILLCDGAQENNLRDMYSWVMNNTWETNFKLELSGFGEFRYSLSLMDKMPAEECFSVMEDISGGVYTVIVE